MTIVTSESVNKGHPDKTCDIIADAILDEALRQDPNSQMAVECAIKNNLLMIYGEATTKAKLNFKKIAKSVLKEVGYQKKFRFVVEVSSQSPDINQAVISNELKANDQGMVFGYATNETKQFMPLSILLAHKLMEQYENFRLQNKSKYFSDAKSQVSVAYENGKVKKIDTILISVSHAESVENNQIKKDIKENVINPVLQNYKQFNKGDIKLLINTSGKFTIWGSYGDSGCVGRKIVVDTYGGVAKVGGGCFSSKNASKVDRSGAYFARYVAKAIVENNLAQKCEVALSFALGLSSPLNLEIDCFGTERIEVEEIKNIVKQNFNFNLNSIIKELNLLSPVFKQTACYGHFGRENFAWEKYKKLNI